MTKPRLYSKLKTQHRKLTISKQAYESLTEIGEHCNIEPYKVPELLISDDLYNKALLVTDVQGYEDKHIPYEFMCTLPLRKPFEVKQTPYPIINWGEYFCVSINIPASVHAKLKELKEWSYDDVLFKLIHEANNYARPNLIYEASVEFDEHDHKVQIQIDLATRDRLTSLKHEMFPSYDSLLHELMNQYTEAVPTMLTLVNKISAIEEVTGANRGSVHDQILYRNSKTLTHVGNNLYFNSVDTRYYRYNVNKQQFEEDLFVSYILDNTQATNPQLWHSLHKQYGVIK